MLLIKKAALIQSPNREGVFYVYLIGTHLASWLPTQIISVKKTCDIWGDCVVDQTLTFTLAGWLLISVFWHVDIRLAINCKASFLLLHYWKKLLTKIFLGDFFFFHQFFLIQSIMFYDQWVRNKKRAFIFYFLIYINCFLY